VDYEAHTSDPTLTCTYWHVHVNAVNNFKKWQNWK